MIKLFTFCLSVLCFTQIVLGQDINNNKKIVCYYDSESYRRTGDAKFTDFDLDDALKLKLCTHLVYGYAGLSTNSYNIADINTDGHASRYREITVMKVEYPELKIYLSLGGDKYQDAADDSKYMNFLKGGKPLFQNFIESSIDLLKKNEFDGLDLAFQFPRNKPRKVTSKVDIFLKSMYFDFQSEIAKEENPETYKHNFTEFVSDLHKAYKKANLSISLTVLPNVNSSWYFDIPKIHDKFEFINLFAFDFLTPERNPDEADYTAPIYLKDDQNRLPHYNVDFQVQHWIDNSCPANKLNLGIPTYARTWKTTSGSGSTGIPVVPFTAGPAAAGIISKKEGLLSWTEVYQKYTSNFVFHSDSRFGNYAYQVIDKTEKHGTWMSFDGPDFAGMKANYAIQKGLGGVALFDLSYDCFRDVCLNKKYPILNSVAVHLYGNFTKQ